MKRTRMISVFSACLLAACLLAGCSGSSNSPGASSGAVSDVEPGLYLDGEKADLTDPILTIAGQFPVEFDEYRYYFMAIKNNYDNGVSSYWSDPAKNSTLLSSVEESLKNNYAVELLAAENNIALSEYDQTAVDAEIRATVETLGGQDGYQAALGQINATEDLYRTMLLHDRLQNRLLYALYYDDLKAGIEQNYVRAKHVLVAFPEGETDHAETRKRAEEVLQKARAGEDFDKLVQEYGEDPGMVDNLDGYYFTAGEMVQAFEDASFALKPGEISDLVETTHGYHIILRLEMEESYLQSHFAEFMGGEEDMVDDYNIRVEEKAAGLDVSYGGLYDRISVETLQ